MPELVCDRPTAEENVEYYTLAGLPDNPRVELSDDQAYGFAYELDYLPPGDYMLRVSACNSFQCSLPAPFGFTAQAQPLQPTGLRIYLG